MTRLDIQKIIETRLFSEAQYALRKRVHPRTLKRWAANGVGPKPIQIHKKWFYEKTAVFADEREQKRLKKAARP
jgi:hypothetical protein